jgi:hypothetical protein
MAHLLLIDDDPVMIPGQVRQAFPPPGTESRRSAPAPMGSSGPVPGPPM